jgi:hypothetical protein
LERVLDLSAIPSTRLQLFASRLFPELVKECSDFDWVVIHVHQLESFDVHVPNSLSGLLLQWWVINADMDPRPESLVELGNTICGKNKHTSVILENAEEH